MNRFYFSRLATYLRQERPRHIAHLRMALGRAIFWGGAIIVGLLAVAFAKSADAMSGVFRHAHEHMPLLPLLVTPLAGALCVFLTRRFFSAAAGSGIPQTLAEMRREDDDLRPLLSLRIAAGKIGVGVMAVGSGFSLGREGPTVQVGASIMAAVHRHLPRSLGIQRHHLLVAGGSAGIAAAFNTPLAGIIFAIEEMSRSVEARMSGLVITAIVLAGVVSKVFMGGGHYFGHVLIESNDSVLLACVALATLSTGLAGGVFARMLILAATRWTGRVADYRRHHPIRFAALCGLLVALLGIVSGGLTFGSGYEQTLQVLHGYGELPWYFAPAKFIATVTAYLSGLPGGIFAPSLSIGAGIGNTLSDMLGTPATQSMLIALCMTGFLAAVTQAPITSFVIVMEMVDGYSLIIGLMATALLASAISRLLSPPLYHTLAMIEYEKARDSEHTQLAATPPSER
ncbi:chloride channel protein [Uliginosibacterium sp. H3]|uniref:Chloride channel protein n=1 Tax=Uliginosibacterium silvisoli TaxID=3114758 RepID=A0ABU6K5F5_9RHOO|nr:chloride channel protein [Uliginosibacterium sp. H3]